jgi:hypothetical protein
MYSVARPPFVVHKPTPAKRHTKSVSHLDLTLPSAYVECHRRTKDDKPQPRVQKEVACMNATAKFLVEGEITVLRRGYLGALAQRFVPSLLLFFVRVSHGKVGKRGESPHIEGDVLGAIELLEFSR